MSLFHRTAGLIASRRLISSLNRHHPDGWKVTSSCPFSSNSGNGQEPTENALRARQYSLLYARSPSRSIHPRAMLAFSSFNALYWLWYTFDFTPSVNASAYEKAALNQIDAETLELLLVDSTMGCVGLGIALVIWGGSVWYPKHLVSAIWKSDDEMAITTLSMPFISVPSILGGEHNKKFTEDQLKMESNIQFYKTEEIGIVGEREKNEIIVKLDGELGKKRGHLALQVNDPNNTSSDFLSRFNKKNYLLDIGSEDEIVDGANADLLKALLSKELEEQQNNNSSNSRRHKTKVDSDEDYVQIRPKKFGKKRR